MALGDCCKHMSIAVADADYSGSSRYERLWERLRALHRCPWCFAKVNTDKTEGGDAKEAESNDIIDGSV